MQAIVDIRWSVACLAGLIATLVLFLALPGLAYKRLETQSSIMTVDFRDWQLESLPIAVPPKRKPVEKKVAERPQAPPVVKQDPPPLPLAPQVMAEKILPQEHIPEVKTDQQPESVPSVTVTVPVPIFRLTALPRFAHKEPPVYPDNMLLVGKEAIVQLEILIDKEGKVRDITILRSAGKEFDEAAKKAMQQSTFIPGNVAGEAVASLYRAPVTFKLR